jgi:hypothetical protein
VDEKSLLSGCGWAGDGSFDEPAAFEPGAGADQRDESRCVDRPPAPLSGLDELERHGEAGGLRSRALGDLGAVPDGGEGRLDSSTAPAEVSTCRGLA